MQRTVICNITELKYENSPIHSISVRVTYWKKKLWKGLENIAYRFNISKCLIIYKYIVIICVLKKSIWLKKEDYHNLHFSWCGYSNVFIWFEAAVTFSINLHVMMLYRIYQCINIVFTMLFNNTHTYTAMYNLTIKSFINK